MEKTKKVPVCGGGGKINKHNGWLLLSIKASLSLQAQSVVSMLDTSPCFIHPWTVSFDSVGLYSWGFVELDGHRCWTTDVKVDRAPMEGWMASSKFPWRGGYSFQDFSSLPHSTASKAFWSRPLFAVVLLCLPLQPFLRKIWGALWFLRCSVQNGLQFSYLLICFHLACQYAFICARIYVCYLTMSCIFLT